MSKKVYNRTARIILPQPVEISMPISAERLGLEPNTKLYKMGDCQIMIGSTLETGWHLSITCQDRYPTWDEIAHARYTLLPASILMAMLLPPMQEYVNIHPNCFHLWQIPNRYAR
jgi:hypothetical protein